MDRANGVVVCEWLKRLFFVGGMSFFLFSATGCNDRLKRMESNQIVLEEKIDHNSRQVFVLARKMDMSQAMLEVRIDRAQEGNNVALAETRATRYEQEKLREDTRQFSKKWAAGIMRVEEHQRRLQDAVNGVAGTATVIDEGVQKLDTGQGVTHEKMAENQTETRAGIAQVRLGQTDLKAAAAEAVDDLRKGQHAITAVASEGVAATVRLSHKVTDVQVSQDAQTGIMREHQKAVIAKVDDVANDQQRYQRSSARQVRQLSQKVTAGQLEQKKAAALQDDRVAQRADAIDASLKATQQNQEDLAVQIKGHHEYAVALGTHVTAIEDEQTRMNESIQQGNRAVDSAVKAVGKNHEELQKTLTNVEATTVATHKQTGAIAEKQSQFHTAEDQRHNSVMQVLDGLEATQNKAQSTLDQIDRQGQAIVRDTDTIRNRQSELEQGLQTEGAHIRQGLSRLEKNQGELKDSLDGVEAAAEAISKDTRDLKQGQSALERDVQSGHAGISQSVGQVSETQADLNSMLKSGKTDLDAELKSIGQNQAGLRAGLSDQKNMSQDMDKQIKLMQQDQTRMSQTMDQQRKAWEDQSGDLANRVAALEESLGRVDQNISSLQTHLVSQITELTKVIKALQAQGGAQIAQLTDDMKVFNGTLKQIQAAQSNLARRIEQVGANQTEQSQGFLMALEKLQKQAQPISESKPVDVASQDVDVVK